jgi:hypothetical protein
MVTVKMTCEVGDPVAVLAGAIEETLDPLADGDAMARAANYSRFHPSPRRMSSPSRMWRET